MFAAQPTGGVSYQIKYQPDENYYHRDQSDNQKPVGFFTVDGWVTIWQVALFQTQNAFVSYFRREVTPEIITLI